MHKLLVGISLFSLISSSFTLSLGETINQSNLAAATTTSNTLLIAKNPNYAIYQVNKAQGKLRVFTNQNKQIFAFSWDDEQGVDLHELLGSYYPQFKKAWNNRPNKFNHRFLNIDTGNVVVEQFGMMQSGFHGNAYVKNLAPANLDMQATLNAN